MLSDDEELLKSEFIQRSTDRTSALEAGKIALANRIFDAIYKKCAVKIRQLPDKGLTLLSFLVYDELPEVRSNAAYLLLPLNETLAKATLKTISTQALPWLSSSARTTLDEWNKGALDVDWFLRANR